MTAVTLSFGNLFFSSLLFFLSGKLYSGKSSFKKMIFAVSFSFVPVLMILILTIPEINYLQKDVIAFKPKILTNVLLLNIHIFIYIIKRLLILFSAYLLVLSISIVQEISTAKSILNILTGLLIPLIVIFIFYLMAFLIYKSLN